jgi:hypothetical protein
MSADILRAAKAKITEPAKWCQEASALDSEGKVVQCHSSRAARWCALGALWSSGAAYPYFAYEYLLSAAKNLYPGEWSVSNVNDSADHAAVMVLYDEAIRLAEGEATRLAKR